MNSISVPVTYTRVFGTTPESGNPCPVVCDADALSTAQMQALAAQFGVETAFVLSPQVPGADMRLRYFVPLHEMEMCVHATIGAITILVRQHRLTASPVQIETSLGILPVLWECEGETIWVTVEQFPPTFAAERPSSAEVAAVLRLPETTIDRSLGPIQSVSVSRAKLIIPLVDFVALDTCSPDAERVRLLCEKYQATGLYPFTSKPRSPNLQVEARQFPKQAGYLEDPATGVAAAALAAYLLKYAVLEEFSEGWHSFVIGQGQAMGEPCLLRAAALVQDGLFKRICVTGHAYILGEAQADR
jgi:PhzF family phenazine biosynthesis protein